MLTLKNIKTFNGMDGVGFSASVYIDGKSVGEAIDEGRGGCISLRMSMADRKRVEQICYDEVNANRSTFPYLFDESNSEATPKIFEPEGAWLNHLVSLHDLEKRLKSWCKTKVVLKEGAEYFTIKMKYESRHEAALVAKYPNAEIVNKRFL